MRIKDDLEQRLAENLRDMAQLANRENEDFREVRIKLAEAQSRIAELEKDAARYRFVRSPTSGDFGVELIFDIAKHPQLRTRGNVDMAVDAAIDVALKSRA